MLIVVVIGYLVAALLPEPWPLMTMYFVALCLALKCEVLGNRLKVVQTLMALGKREGPWGVE